MVLARAHRSQKARVYLDWFEGSSKFQNVPGEHPEITGNTFISTIPENIFKLLSPFCQLSVQDLKFKNYLSGYLSEVLRFFTSFETFC